VRLGQLPVSRFIIGGNPFSGFSHQGRDRDVEMRHFYTTERLKQTLRDAEALGIFTHIGRADHHVMRLLLEYWDGGGQMQWIAQTCPEVGSMERCVQNAISGGAKACFLHGGWIDSQFAAGKLDEIPRRIEQIRAAGMPAGIAGHNPAVFEWAAQNVDVDFYMCSYYNPIPRNERGEHMPVKEELFRASDRDLMTRTLAKLPRPVIHYKVMAAGRNVPAEAFDYVAAHMRPGDAVCVGVFVKDRPDMLKENLRLFAASLRKAGIPTQEGRG
jgi:hypothetical protein